jgi:uncharacterized protein YraI
MNLRSQPVRLAAAVGAVIAAGTTTFFALAAGTASADEPGRCTQNVNVREEPDATSRIVALCESGTQVMLGAEQDGWVRLDEQGGWASKEFVKADETASGSSTSRDRDGEHSSSSDSGSSSGSSGDDADDDEHSAATDSGSSAGGSTSHTRGRNALGGLLN